MWFRLSEQQLGVGLLRHREAKDPGSLSHFDQVMYARTPARRDVDFTGPWMRGVSIESKYVQEPWCREAQTLRAHKGRGMMATASVTSLAGPVWAVPAGIVALIIDPSEMELTSPPLRAGRAAAR